MGEKMNFDVIPEVSILMLTYNHNSFIREAITSCIQQRTNFSFELIICDDFSTDGTIDTINEIYDEYPEHIVLSMQSKNTGGPKNLEDGLRKVRGRYIAFCEGDDFWCDHNKLQVQFDFLENNSDFTLCFHNTKVLYEFEFVGDTAYYPSAGFLLKSIYPKDGILTLKDLIGTYEAHTSSYFGRWPYINGFPDDWSVHKGQDLFFMPIIVGDGKIKHINRLMSMYRRHETGYTLLMNSSYRDFFINRGEKWIELYKELNDYTNDKYIIEVNYRISIALKNMALYYISNRDFKQLKVLLTNYYDYFFSRSNLTAIFDRKYPTTTILCFAFQRGIRYSLSRKKVIKKTLFYIKLHYYLGLLFKETIEL